MRTKTARLTGGAALLGGRAKAEVIHVLFDKAEVTLTELVERTKMSKSANTNAVKQLKEAGIVRVRKHAKELVVCVRPEGKKIIEDITALDRSALPVHPVPGVPLADADLDMFASFIATRPGAVVTDVRPLHPDEQSVPMAQLVWSESGVE